MEKLLNQKADQYIKNFKLQIQERLLSLSLPEQELACLNHFIVNYEKLVFSKEDLVKRKRVKNEINVNERCVAKRANGEQCSRRRKNTDNLYCGTHEKGRPHGEIKIEEFEKKTEHQVQVFAQEIQGIIYYLDNAGNVYNTEEIVTNKKNPQVIAKYTREGESFSIPTFNI